MAESHNPPVSPPFSLDPRIDRERFREMAADVLDLAGEWIGAEADDPVLSALPGPKLKQRLDEPAPEVAGDWAEAIASLREDVLPSCRRNGHPRFLAYVSASAEPVGVLADLLASALNQNVTTWRSAPAAATVERQVVAWLDRAVGFDGGHGLLVGGGSAANFDGLCLAIQKASEEHGPDRSRMVVYLSRETHLSIAKAARILGIREQNIRKLPVDAHHRMDVNALTEAIRADAEAGLVPTCVVGSAGTANTGAIDPLATIAEVANDAGLWFHVDGAYGAPAAMTEGYAWLKDAFGRADSLSLDPHKWLYAPLDAGCLLTRHPELSTRTFSIEADYVTVEQTDAVERFAFFDHGMELSRRFRALKLWLMLKVIGLDRIRERIAEDIAIREHLDRRIADEPRLEALGSDLSISCFRYLPGEGGDPDAVNQRIREGLVDSGRFLLSPTRVDGHYALRVCIVNFRTRRGDMGELVDEVLRLGAHEGA